MKELKEFSSEEEYVPRSIQYIVVHCSATRANIPFTEEQLLTENFITAVRYQSRVRMCEALTGTA